MSETATPPPAAAAVTPIKKPLRRKRNLTVLTLVFIAIA